MDTFDRWKREYFVSESHGFLLQDPLSDLPKYFQPWTVLARNLDTYVAEHSFRQHAEKMPLLDHTQLQGYRQHRAAHLFLTFIASAFVWQDGDEVVVKVLPCNISVPLCGISSYLGLPPIICYSDGVLANFKKIDPMGPLDIRNLECICVSPGERGCEWFFLIAIQTELTFAPALPHIAQSIESAGDEDVEKLTSSLNHITTIVHQFRKALSHMHDELDPGLFYNTVRPFLNGWGGPGSALPDGLVYEDVWDTPRQFRGGNGAQSTTLQCLDMLLGIQHDQDGLAFFEEMRHYMPPAHKQLVEEIKKRSKVRHFVKASGNPDLTKAFDECVKALKDMRSYHLQMVVKYVTIQSNMKTKYDKFNDVAKKGTGGQNSPLEFLKSVRNTTAAGAMAE